MDGASAPPDRVCLGVIIGVHGIRGAVKIKPFTAEARDVGAYGPVADEAGHTFALRVTDARGGLVVASIKGVEDRNTAERLKGVRLYVDRAALPPPDDGEYYHADLIGVAVELEDGTFYGSVRSVDNFGAGDIIELQPAGGGKTVTLPFTRDFVPLVDVAGRRIVVCLPDTAPDEGRNGRVLARRRSDAVPADVSGAFGTFAGGPGARGRRLVAGDGRHSRLRAR